MFKIKRYLSIVTKEPSCSDCNCKYIKINAYNFTLLYKLNFNKKPKKKQINETTL